MSITFPNYRTTSLAVLLGTCLAAAATAQDVAQELPQEAEPAVAAEADDDAPDTAVPVAPTPILLVIGAGGTPEYSQQFRGWADRWLEVAETSGAEVTQIGRTASDTPDRDRLEKAIRSLDADAATPVWIVLIGHGTYARGTAKFNLQGRDVSARELSQWLEPVKRPVVVVDCASASGPFVNRLSAPGRTIVTATKSGLEQNFARFGKYFADAISSPESDLDHDGEVSVQEAFLRASAGVQEFYDAESRISTEHALIDDNGDGKGTPAKMFRGVRVVGTAKDGSEIDGKRASRITLSLSKNRLPFSAEELAQRDELEAELDRLRGSKPRMDPEVYQSELETLFLRLAKLYRTAEQRK